jgi:plastocyanin
MRSDAQRNGSYRSKILFLLGIFILALAVSAAMPNAEAGTVLAQPEPAEKLAPGESYPESRFGRPPAKVDTGVSRGYASRAVEEMETHDEYGGEYGGEGNSSVGASRSPAGLQFADGVSQAREGSTRPRSMLSVSSAPKALSEPIEATTSSLVASRKGVQEVAIIASDLGYFPKTVFVSRDVPVRMFVTSSSKNTLCIMMDSFTIRKQVRSQKIEEITFTPNVPGKYRFYCPVNGMEGTMVVKEFASQLAGYNDAIESQASAPARRAPASSAAPIPTAPVAGQPRQDTFDAQVPEGEE